MSQTFITSAVTDKDALLANLTDAKQRLAQVRDDLREIADEAQSLLDDLEPVAVDLDTTIDTLSHYV